MKHQAIALLATVLLVGGCSGSEPVSKTQTSPPTAAEELDAAVRAAARALIDVPGASATEFTYGDGGTLSTTRWLQWSANGDVILVVAGIADVGGLVQVRGNLMVASSGAAGDKSWGREAPPLESRGDPGVAFNLDLPAMANGSILRSLDGMAVAEVQVTSEATADGGILWSLSNPLRGATATREWLIDAAGVLRYYSLTSDSTEPVFEAFTSVEAQFDPVSEPAPVLLPEEGTSLDLTQLGLPADLPLP